VLTDQITHWDAASPSFRISTICASVNLDLRMAFLPCGRVYYYPVALVGKPTLPLGAR